MRRIRFRHRQCWSDCLRAVWLGLAGSVGIFCLASVPLSSQTQTVQQSLEKQVEQLTQIMARTQAQLEESQRQMDEMRRQIDTLKQQIADAGAETAAAQAAEKLAREVEDIRERQAMQESQIATHEQAKVESSSKYGLKLTGLILLNGFVNTNRVDMVATPSIASPGAGSTGASVKQTILGLQAHGPHLFGATSRADLSLDFNGGSQPSGGGSGAYNGDILRLRTAHAMLDWEHAEAFFSYDRPIVSPLSPDSLTAVAIPALAWSGNLWTWNPQIGVTQNISVSTRQRLRLQAALIDVANPPVLYNTPSSSTPATNSPPSTAEQSRWPGVETRIALLGNGTETGAQIGVGGYFAPHRTLGGTRWNAWAGTMDYRQPLPGRMEFAGSFYRGLSLGGLGGGAYKDYLFRIDPNNPSASYYETLDDVGGWAQLKQRATSRLEFNEAFGIDNVPAGQLRPFANTANAIYQNLARNRTYTANVIYSPSAYLLFSLEYRYLLSSPVIGTTNPANIIGVAAGYKF